MWNLVSHTTEETSIKGDLEQGAGKNIWTAKESNNTMAKKAA
jgi:hypothetical protein